MREEKSLTDHVKILTAAAISAIPGIGGPLATVLQEYIPLTIEKRRNETIRQLAEELQRLENRVDDQKMRSEAFHITLIKTMRLLTVERHQEKLDAFRNIILNEAINQTENPELDFFVYVTDSLTGDHIRMLKIFGNPKAFVEADANLKKRFDELSFGGLGDILRPAFPRFDRNHLESMLDDLHQKALSNARRDSYATVSTPGSILQKKTTPLGDRYLQFLTRP